MCTKAQSNWIILSKVTVLADTDADGNDNKQTNPVVKTIFSPHLRGLKTSKFDENLNSHLSHKTNTFSYGEIKSYIVLSLKKININGFYSEIMNSKQI